MASNAVWAANESWTEVEQLLGRCPGKMLNHSLSGERILIQTDSRFDCGGGMADKRKKRWVASVKTDSTHPPAGLFTKSATIIARTLASKEVSPKGPSSGVRMLTFFINRAGRGLSPERRAELEKEVLAFETTGSRPRKTGRKDCRLRPLKRRAASALPVPSVSVPLCGH